MTRKIMVAMVALLCAALAIGALGCGNKANGNPEQSVTDFWNALKKGDVKGASKYVSTDLKATGSLESLEGSESTESDAIMVMMKYMNLVPVSSTISGDTAVVKAKLTSPDMDAILEQLMSIVGEIMSSGADVANMTQEQINDAYMKGLEGLLEDTETTTFDEEIEMVWEDNLWKLNSNPFAAIQGGMGFEGM